jgi:hypothetical protein
MTHLVTYTAVVGRFVLLPVVQRVEVGTPPVTCFVEHGYPDQIADSGWAVSLQVHDCTLFKVQHQDCGERDVSPPDGAEAILEQTLQAINEVLIWFRTEKEEIQNQNAFLRQIGRTDIKYFLIPSPDDSRLVLGKNPMFDLDRSGLAQMMAAFPTRDVVMINGTWKNSPTVEVHRAMASLSLVDLGFYTEAFVTMFSLVDDLTQRVLRAGMEKRGLSEDQQKSMLRAIKEERLQHFLTGVSLLCGWESLEAADAGLFKQLLKVNTRRNAVMHGSARIRSKSQVMADMNVLLDVLQWLASNPFGYNVPKIDRENTASLKFTVADRTASPAEANDKDAPAPLPPQTHQS